MKWQKKYCAPRFMGIPGRNCFSIFENFLWVVAGVAVIGGFLS